MVATVLNIFTRINCPIVIGLVRHRHTKFQIDMAAALPAIPLLAPLPRNTWKGDLEQEMWTAGFRYNWKKMKVAA